MNKTEHELAEFLETKLSKTGIVKTVAETALDYDPVSAFFEDINQYGCVSWMISELIYYSDTRAFFQTHYDEIEELRNQWEEDTGMPLVIQGDLSNFLAWLSFERVADNLWQEFEAEYL